MNKKIILFSIIFAFLIISIPSFAEAWCWTDDDCTWCYYCSWTFSCKPVGGSGWSSICGKSVSGSYCYQQEGPYDGCVGNRPCYGDIYCSPPHAGCSVSYYYGSDCGPRTCTPYTYYCVSNRYLYRQYTCSGGCSGNSCRSSNTYTSFVDDCGPRTCTPYTYYCVSNRYLYRQYTCSGGCSGGSCRASNTYTSYVEDCGSGFYWTNNYSCDGGQPIRQYYIKGCSGGSCYKYYYWADYGDNCDVNDYWSGYYCGSGNVIKRNYYDYYCSGGSCYYNTNTYSYGDCDNQDGWNNKGSPYSCCNGNKTCSCQDKEYRDYYCSGGSCAYSITNTQTIQSGCSCVVGSCGAECSTNADCDDGNPVTIDTCEADCTCSHIITCGNGSCDSGETVWNCCPDCGVPAPGCDDLDTKYWYTCDNHTPTKHTDSCENLENPHCDCDGYAKKYFTEDCGCSEGSCVLNWSDCSCVIGSCGADCSTNADCADNTCSVTYDDYCDGKKLVEYDSDKIKDSTIVTNSCSNTCQADCTCTDCTPDCSAPSTNSYCVKGVCGAECSTDADCDDGDPKTADTCEADCTCSYAAPNRPPDKSSDLKEVWDHCNFTGFPQVALGTSIILNWTYSDPDDVPKGKDPQTAYKIQVAENPLFWGPKFTHTVTGDSGRSTAYTLNLDDDEDGDWLSELAWGATYYWRVRVKDSKKWSPWSWSFLDLPKLPKSFTMPPHSYPNPYFNFTERSYSVDEVITFTDTSHCYYPDESWYRCGTDVYEDTSYEWDFGGEGIKHDEGDTTWSFSKSGRYTVTLSVTDFLGICSYSKEIRIGIPLPEWREITPF